MILSKPDFSFLNASNIRDRDAGKPTSRQQQIGV
jgi:hypothetical protein